MNIKIIIMFFWGHAMAGKVHYPGIIVTSCHNYILGIHGIHVFQLYSRRATPLKVQLRDLA